MHLKFHLTSSYSKEIPVVLGEKAEVIRIELGDMPEILDIIRIAAKKSDEDSECTLEYIEFAMS